MTFLIKLNRSKQITWLTEHLWRLSWGIIALIFIAMFVFELEEHWPINITNLESDFLRETVFFTAGTSLSIWIAFKHWSRSRKIWVDKIKYLDRLQAVNRQLTRIERWDELTYRMLVLLQEYAPIRAATLWLFDRSTESFEFISRVNSSEENEIPLQGTESRIACNFVSAQSSLFPSISPCLCSLRAESSNPSRHYCLPLIHAGLPIAMIQLYLPPGVSFSQEQVQFLHDMAPEMAMAIDAVQPQTSASVKARIVDVERRNISRLLHGTLGQDLAFLQLKLDQVIQDIRLLSDPDAAQQELQNILELASLTSQKTRALMSELNGSLSNDLGGRLVEHAESVAQRANIRLLLACEGEPRPLPASIQRQVYFIFEEALTNIVKHSGAEEVRIRIAWMEDCLHLDISDDGNGFDPNLIQDANRHFGLTMIKDITDELDAVYRIESSNEFWYTTHLFVAIKPNRELSS